MTGRNHIVTGIGTLGVTMSVPAATAAYHGYGEAALHSLGARIEDMACVPVGRLPVIFGIQVGILLFLLGTLLPDIDSRKSILGKVAYLPIRHRTWTHSIWPVVVFMALGVLWPGFFWLGLGYLTHLFMDCLSRQGICWFYPISGYRYYPGGASVKKGKKFWLYRTGQRSEHVTALVYMIICGAFILLSGWPSIMNFMNVG